MPIHVQFCARCRSICSMASSSSDAIVPHGQAPPAKKSRIDATVARELTACSKQTKTALIHTLQKLNIVGALEHGATKRELRKATEHHAKQETPYGRVVEKIELDVPGMKYLDIVNPFAFLWYLCHISVHFADLMYKCCISGNPLRLVIYADEMCPGNPFRPEKSRTLQCIYWAFADWPAHVLSRTFAWIVLCTIRSSIVSKIEGGMSYMCRLFLRMFYPETGHSFARGIMLQCKDTTYMMTAVFAGFLCDLKGHKENLEWVGTGGNRCCLTCANLDKRVTGDHDVAIGLDCSNAKKFIKRSNEDVYADIDELERRSHGESKTKKSRLQTEYGFNLIPNGILMDKSIRGIFKPVDHTLRDWQHTLVGDGVANSILGETITHLKQLKYPTQSLRDFMMECTLPSKYGKACADWLKDSRICVHTLRSFSGIVLTLVPILFLYMQAFCKDDPRLSEHISIVEDLYHICGILATGSDTPMKYVDVLYTLFERLHDRYVKLYTSIKPKLHHMHHILDAMRWLGKCLSCFVTERKHRTVKDLALYVFRNMEHTLIVDIVNQHCEQLLSGHDLFEAMFLVEPRECKLQPDILASKNAVLPCGPLRNEDVIFFENMACAVVKCFFIISDMYFVEVVELPCVDGDVSLRRFTTSGDTVFKECRFVVDSCIWHHTDDADLIRVCVPPVLLYR